MMLDDLDHQTATLSGVLDLPGAAHAHTFQSVPGKAQAYARLEIFSKGIEFLPSEPQHFNLMVRPSDDGRRSSGHWPRIAKRSAQISQGPKIEMASPGLTMQIPPRASAGPTDAEIDTWVNKVLATLEGVKAARDVDIHPRLIRVQDHRRNAQSGALGRSADGGGSDNAGWWLEIKKSVKDNIVLRELYRSAAGARIWLPDATNLYRLPGPNWYRPWSPQIVLLGAGRSYKYGEDSRFRDDGFVTCRFSGETLSGIRIGPQATIRGREALANAVPLTAMPSVPKEVRALVEETLLLDPDSSAVLRLQISATTRLSDAVFKSAIRGLWLKRDSELLSEAENKAMAAVQGLGQVPSGIAITPWGEDPHDPLFVDVEYAHPHSSLQEDWTLEPDSVEMTPAAPKATQPPAGQVIQLQERAYVTSTIAKVLDSKLVSKLSVDQKGNLVRAQTRPKGVEDTTFKKLDVLSAPLTQFDEKLFGTGRRERTGALRINRLELVDVYGVVRRWNSGITDGNSPAGGNDLAWWTELPPRLPYWSRLQVRLQAAFNPSVDATPLDPIICGFLLPDFLEHSLEVFDGMGMALGQLVSDRPQKDSMGATAETILKVKFVPHPWVQSGNGHLTVITNPILRSVVAGLEAQETKVPPGQPSWFETGLTAFLRVVDTIRSLLDPSVKAPDLKVRLLGEPIVVLQTRLTLEGTSNRSPSSLVGRPEPLASEPSLPSIHVRVGDVNRPDDGVLGCFLPPPPGEEVDSSKSRFAPVSKEAAEKALINGMVHELKGWVIPVDHPFIKEQVSEFDIRVGETKDLTVLMDTRGGMYATCGVLPRKKITLPREHLDMGLGHLEPTFRTGPVLAQVEKDSIKPAIPSIDLQGLDSQLVRQLPNSSNFDETPLPKVLPVSELPQGRVFLTEGWVRVSRPKLQK
jgi:hypothetical protein